MLNTPLSINLFWAANNTQNMYFWEYFWVFVLFPVIFTYTLPYSVTMPDCLLNSFLFISIHCHLHLNFSTKMIKRNLVRHVRCFLKTLFIFWVHFWYLYASPLKKWPRDVLILTSYLHNRSIWSTHTLTDLFLWTVINASSFTSC